MTGTPRRAVAIAAAMATAATTSCALTASSAAPQCGSTERLATVAQSVPEASYVPCLAELPVGWRTTAFSVGDDGTRLELLSDRSGGRPVRVDLVDSCRTDGATPTRPRAPGVRSALLLDSVSPRYAGTAFDVFPGGCLRASFDFPRGEHIPLMEELAALVELVPRRELAVSVRRELGVELDP